MTFRLLRNEPLSRPLLVCLVAAALCVFTYNIVDPDLWGHARYGADTIARGSLFQTDPYSYLSDGFPWINHELVCELTFGFLQPRFGAAGLLAWKCLMGFVTVGAIAWIHRRGEFGLTTVVLVAALVLLNLWDGWLVRPQVFTYAFLSLLALMLTEHDCCRRARLWFAPLLIVAWTNSHGGFVAGLGVLGVHLGFAFLDEVRTRNAGWRRRATELVAIVLASFAATLVNPYGFELLKWVWNSLAWPRPEITEWEPVSLLSLDCFAFKTLVFVTFASLALSRQPRAWSRMTNLALAAAQAFLHRRHVPLFAILAAFWLPEHLEDALARLRNTLFARVNLPEADTRTQRIHAWLLAALAVFFGSVTAWQARGLRVDRSFYPVSAFRFIHARGLGGRMVTEFNWGQYALDAFWPRILVSVDGRFDTSYSRETLDINFDFMLGDIPRLRNRSPATGPFRADRILDEGSPNLALVERTHTGAVRAISKRGDWVLLYQDALAQVWGRASIYDDAASIDFLPLELRSISDSPQAGDVAYPAYPSQVASSH